ncbi:MAG: H4MPT-linked C1 transfer pathway protein [Planctomycetes bacterium]|nr:H4MPT-linked C1 transfer pathway protein [Planctomycetota bacterium]
MTILGLDIGGANIKAADAAGRTLSRPFAIWKHPEQLAPQIESICGEFPNCSQLAVTMTAELADCFTTKAEGVRKILDQVDACQIGDPCAVWTTDGRFVTSAEARANPLLVAAANWHALATWVGRQQLSASSVPVGTALLVDIGTTTTDIIPLIDGIPATLGRTDVSRLQSGELCYSGVKRTPLCAIAYSVPFRDGYCAVAAELFATTLDVYLLLGDIPEDEHDLETANGKPATRTAAHDRIARLLCGDREDVSEAEAVQVARFLADVQRQRLAGALERILQRLTSPCETVIVSGSGSFLARRLVAQNRRLASANVISLDEILSPGIAEAACAYAVARLCSM